MSNAEELFEQFRERGMTLIEEVVSEQWSENQILEFKQAAKSRGPLDEKDRKNFSKAISGFANAEGGLIIWGILANKTNPEDADVATQLKPIKKIRHFTSDLQAQTPQLASPGVVGVSHFEIPDTNDSDSGYAVTYIPGSNGEPCMATAKDEHRFYIRVGSSFIKMSSSMLADRYSRRPQPCLEFFWRISQRQHQVNPPRVSVTIGIRNVGRGTALYPALKVTLKPGVCIHDHGLDGNLKHGFTLIPTETSREMDFLFCWGLRYGHLSGHGVFSYKTQHKPQ